MLIPGEATWWRENQNRTQRVQILSRDVGSADYDLITQSLWAFLGIWPPLPVPQFQSPTFPSSQPVVVEWAIGGTDAGNPGSIALSAIGLPTSFTHAMTGDPLTALDQDRRMCVIVTWRYQGQDQSQVCDANTSQLAISLADSVSVTYLRYDPVSFLARAPLLVSVYPGRGVSTAKITSAPQSLHNGGPPIAPLIPVGTWARVKRWRWFWGQTTPAVPGGVMALEVAVSTTAGLVLARWLDLAGTLPGAPVLVGGTPLLVFDRWEPWVPDASLIQLQPQGIDLDYATLVAEIQPEV